MFLVSSHQPQLHGQFELGFLFSRVFFQDVLNCVCVCVCCRWGEQKSSDVSGEKNLFSPFNVVVVLTHLLVMTNDCVGVEVSDKS